MMLDATAGHRMMWKNKNPPLTVFMDKRGSELRISPDIIAIWEYLPFRDDVFKTTLFDPPHIVRSGGFDSRFKLHGEFGVWSSRQIMIRAILLAQREFSRVSRRLCFKWGETRESGTLWRLLPLFTEWREVHRKKNVSRSGITKNNVWWVTFVRAHNIPKK